VPKTIWGKIAVGVLIGLILQAVLFVVMLYENGFGAMVRFLQLTPYTATLGVAIGIIGLIKEKNSGKLVPTLALAISVIYTALFFLLLFGYQFGG
jgi:hypothetical protein